MSAMTGDHPRGNYWFASHDQDDDDDLNAEFPWRVFIQLPGMVDHLSVRFPTEEAAEAFIREDILGAGADIGKHPVVPGQVVAEVAAIGSGLTR